MQRVMQKRTFIHQSKLPRLPVPALQDTLAVYLKSVKPLLSPENIKQTEKVVNEFQKPAGFGNKLQQRLVEYEAKQPYSWLEEWWLKMAYHSWREPSMINSNWYLVMKDHPNSPSFVPNLSGITDFQINRAAGNLI